ncbi:transporter substrate-binding domain-containing protein [Marinobacter sp. CHS3-4]|uniref:substrate-binding periplasmic protein n=1 Tax=Marinobacter sp. CHS3-4 TaxID=3045174 RepID=UPI0024B47FE3|nr:transporter substrate-binding domain-containing protein [Marinobacter sp. CHS3-4]MDI9246344.1 transporter substrate-binding domain-containing protein [Marinobacter sp. CHS3-4]
MARTDAQTQADNSLTIVYDSFAQFIHTKEDEPTGLFVDVLNEALEERMGVSVQFIWQPWQRAQYSVETGQADGMVTVATPERLDYSRAVDTPIAHSSVAVFTSKGHPRMPEIREIETVADLEGFQLLTYLGDGWAKEKLGDIDVDFGGKDIEAIFKKLRWGRGDLFLQSRDVTEYYIEELGYEDAIVRVPGVEFGHIEFHLMIGKASPFLPLLPELDKRLREMREDGTNHRLQQSYEHVY